jgi:uncharacterized membrane protein YjgN (DUF898 family)
MNPQAASAPADGSLTASPLITGNGPSPHQPAGLPQASRQYPIEFTGSGSEYFRIWVVNLLLMLITFGIYYPWAKVRKLRYIYGNTVVAGHALDFHGEPKRMLRGFLLVSLLMGLYSVAGRISPTAGAVAGLILAALWPALLRASLQFRLANTSWRGLRFGFTGSLKDAYLVFVMPMLAMVGAGLLAAIIMAMLPGSARGVVGVLAMVAAIVGMVALGPYVWWRVKHYQHNHYALGQWQTTFKASYGQVLGVFMKTGLVGMAGMLAAAIAVGVLAAAGTLSLSEHGDPLSFKTIFAMVVPVLVGFIVVSQLVQGPFFTSRMQNLVWTQTGNRHVRFKSHLPLLPLVGLTLKNWLLVVCTLGLYWPFAAMALTRMKLQAITVHTRQDPDVLLSQERPGAQDAAGDLAADMIGIDFGL